MPTNKPNIVHRPLLISFFGVNPKTCASSTASSYCLSLKYLTIIFACWRWYLRDETRRDAKTPSVEREDTFSNHARMCHPTRTIAHYDQPPSHTTHTAHHASHITPARARNTSTHVLHRRRRLARARHHHRAPSRGATARDDARAHRAHRRRRRRRRHRMHRHRRRRVHRARRSLPTSPSSSSSLDVDDVDVIGRSTDRTRGVAQSIDRWNDRWTDGPIDGTIDGPID